MKMTVILSNKEISENIQRIAKEILENNRSTDNVLLVGIRRGGAYLATRLQEAIAKYRPALKLVDVTCDVGDHLAAHNHYLEAISEYRTALNMDSELSLPEAVTEEVIYALGLRRDRRKHERFSHWFSVKHWERIAGPWHPGTTVNISKQGLLVESSRKIEVGSKVKIITPVNQDNQSIAIRGRVVWMDRKETGQNYRFGIELFSAGNGNQAWENFLAA